MCLNCRGQACTNAKEAEVNNNDDKETVNRFRWNLRSNGLYQPVDVNLDDVDNLHV